MPFATDPAGAATVDVALPATPPAGRYVAQALLGTEHARAGLSNGLLLLVAPAAR